VTIKVNTDRLDRTVTIADKGKECRIDVDVSCRTRYGDSVAIYTHEGSITFTGNHVHELMKSILRFSSKEMLETWIRFALTTNKASDDPNIDLSTDYYDISDYSVEYEREMRENEIEWNANYYKL